MSFLLRHTKKTPQLKAKPSAIVRVERKEDELREIWVIVLEVLLIRSPEEIFAPRGDSFFVEIGKEEKLLGFLGVGFEVQNHLSLILANEWPRGALV